MLPIVKLPIFVETILPRFSSIFNKAQLRHFGEYLTGLIVSENKTVTGINTQFIDHTDQSSKNHFLTEAEWDENSVTHERLCIVKEKCEKHRITDGLVIIDDSLAHKSGKHIEAANWFWVCKVFHVPLHYRLYRKEEDVPQGAFKSNVFTIGHKCRIASAEILRSFIFWAYQNFNQENEVDKVFKIIMKGNPQLKFEF